MTYKLNGKQYWKRNGVCCSWSEAEGRKVISEEEYLAAIGKKPITSDADIIKVVAKEINNDIKSGKIFNEIDPKSKVEIAYQEIGKNNRIVNKKKVVTHGNLHKVISTMETKDNFVKILATRNL